MPVLEEEFTEVKGTTVADARGRVTLGTKVAKQQYSVSYSAKGQVLLTPVVTFSVPADEAWLYANRAALQAVRTGLDDAAHGRVSDLGSFAQYADLDVGD